MNSTMLIFSCIVLLVAIPHPAIAINCYMCSVGTDGCGASTFSKTGLGVRATADSSSVYCMKTIYPSNSKSAFRSDDTTGSCTPGTVTTFGVVETTYCCSTDLCNSAHTTTAHIIVALLATMIALFFMK